MFCPSSAVKLNLLEGTVQRELGLFGELLSEVGG